VDVEYTLTNGTGIYRKSCLANSFWSPVIEYDEQLSSNIVNVMENKSSVLGHIRKEMHPTLHVRTYWMTTITQI